MLGERGELALPVPLIAGDPLGGSFHRSGVKAATVDPTVFLPREKPGLLEHSEMLRDCGKGYVERFGKRRHRRLSPGQSRQDRSTGRIGQRRKGEVESL